MQRGLPVTGVYAYEPPNPGNHVIGAVLRNKAKIIVGTKNCRDLVCDVPPEDELIEPPEEYVQPVAFLPLNKPGTGIDFLFRDHHYDLIQAGVHALDVAKKPPLFDECIDLVGRLYADTPATRWDWINRADGLYWAMSRINADAIAMIRRGSVTGKDWLHEDFNFKMRDWYGARASIGFCEGVEPVQDQLDTIIAQAAA